MENQPHPQILKEMKKKIIAKQLSIMAINKYYEIAELNICILCSKPQSKDFVVFVDDETTDIIICCFSCLQLINKNLHTVMVEYVNHINIMIETKDLCRDFPSMLDFILLFDDYESKFARSINEFNYQKLLLGKDNDQYYENLLNINWKLLKFYNNELNWQDFGLHRCFCHRYYQSAFGSPKKCHRCLDSPNIGNNLLLNFDKCYDLTPKEFDCPICCNNKKTMTFRFNCGHLICNDCCHNIVTQKAIEDSTDYDITISCPFCRDPYFFPYEITATQWIHNIDGLINDLEMTIAIGRFPSVPPDQRCRHRSNVLLREVMNKHDLPVYQYINKEIMKSSGLYVNKKKPHYYKICTQCCKYFSSLYKCNIKCFSCWQNLKLKSSVSLHK